MSKKKVTKRENTTYDYITEKRKMLNYYSQFLREMDFIPTRGFLEMVDNNEDSVVSFLDDEVYGISLQKENIKTEKSNRIVKTNGNIIIENKKTILEYDNMKTNIDKINFYITKLPVEKEDLELLSDLVKINKYVFIGTYGKIDDKDYMGNLEKLYNLKNEIQLMTDRNFEGEVVTTNDYYFSAISPKLKYKKKNFTN